MKRFNIFLSVTVALLLMAGVAVLAEETVSTNDIVDDPGESVIVAIPENRDDIVIMPYTPTEPQSKDEAGNDITGNTIDKEWIRKNWGYDPDEAFGVSATTSARQIEWYRLQSWTADGKPVYVNSSGQTLSEDYEKSCALYIGTVNGKYSLQIGLPY